MSLKVRVHAWRHADRSQLIVPFDEFNNLQSVSFRPIPIPPRLCRLVRGPVQVTHRGRSRGPAHRWPLKSNKLKLSPHAASGPVPSSPVRYTCTIRSSLPSGSLNQYHPSLVGASVVQITPRPPPTTSMRVDSHGWLKDVSRIQATREIERGQDHDEKEPVTHNASNKAWPTSLHSSSSRPHMRIAHIGYLLLGRRPFFSKS